MQSTSTMSGLPPYQEFIGRLEGYYGVRLRKGQAEFVRAISEDTKSHIFCGVLPTGYGKSKAAECACHMLKETNRADRFLFVVPTDTQRTQYAENIANDVEEMGLNLRLLERTNSAGVEFKTAMVVDGSEKPFIVHKNNACDVYVTTVQHIVANKGYYADLMEKNHWAVFADEFQKYSKDESKKFGPAVSDLNYTILFGLTATHKRSDLTPTIFADVEPSVFVSVEDAYKEQAIRRVVANIEHYFMDIETDSGDIERVTTENAKDYELSKELRIKTKYLSSMLAAAYSCLSTLNGQHPAQNQMLVFAIGVSHARQVSEIMNAMFGSGFSDWIGVGPSGRSSAENKEIVNKYKKNQLQCLVQVDIAGEGFDNPRSSVLVFLHLLKKSTVKAVQHAGRGLRRNYGIKNFDEDICHMFASPDTEMAELAKELAMQTFDPNSIGDDVAKPGDGDNKTPLFDLPPFDSSIKDTEYDRSEIFQKIPQRDIDMFRDQVAIKEGVGAAGTVSDDRLRDILTDFRLEQMNKANAIADHDSSHEEKVKSATSVLVSNAARLKYGSSFPGTVLGDMKRAVNSKWAKTTGKKHANMLDEHFRIKHEWLTEINNRMKSTREVPAWLAL